MGHPYAIPYDTDEQREAILDVIKLHNSYRGGYTDEFVRYNASDEFKQLEVGEELTGASTVALKAGKAYKCPRKGPCLARVVLVGHGGGRSCTFDFFRWHLMRTFPDVYVGGFHAVDAYPFDSAMEQRFLKNSYERIDNARIGVVPHAEYTDAMREANLLAGYTRLPAKYSTRRSGGVPPAWTALMEGVTDNTERKKRRLENPRVSPHSSEYETVTDGWVLEDRHFATEEEAKAYADSIRPAHVEPGCVAAMRAVEMAQLAKEADRNKKRFLELRAQGKGYWECKTVRKGGLYWLTDETVAERRAEGLVMEPANINYEEEGYESGTPWKQASVAEVEAMLGAGKVLALRNC
jgi:hypothetical protein